jgi:hypothetical protein
MALFGYRPEWEEHFLPAPPAVVYTAALTVADRDFKLSTSDDFQQLVEIRATGTGLSWSGEYVTAQAIPHQGGTTLRMSARPRGASGGVLQGTANRRALAAVRTAITDEVRQKMTPPPLPQ